VGISLLIRDLARVLLLPICNSGEAELRLQLFMSKTLIIAEKPNGALDLAPVLGVKKSGDHSESDRYVISSAVGHVVEMVPPEGAEVKRGKWKLENLPVLPDHFDLVPKQKTKERLYLLKKLVERADVTEIINACDAG